MCLKPFGVLLVCAIVIVVACMGVRVCVCAASFVAQCFGLCVCAGVRVCCVLVWVDSTCVGCLCVVASVCSCACSCVLYSWNLGCFNQWRVRVWVNNTLFGCVPGGLVVAWLFVGVLFIVPACWCACVSGCVHVRVSGSLFFVCGCSFVCVRVCVRMCGWLCV